MLAVAQLDSADETAALHTLELLTADDIRRSEAENAWGAVLAPARRRSPPAERRRSQAELLSELLEPFAGRLLVTVDRPGNCLGAADRYQGMLSTTLERWDDAEAHFERALDLEQARPGTRARAPNPVLAGAVPASPCPSRRRP